jgi:transposase
MNKNDFIKLIEKGLSQREISKVLLISQTSVRYWLGKFGLKTNLPLKNKGNTKDDKRENKYCPKCKEEKPLTDFYKRNGRSGVCGYCKKCGNKYHSNRVKEVKIKMIKYKGGACENEKCKLKLEDAHYAVFHFHHLNPKEKDQNFDHIKFQKWEYIMKELDKCIMLCSNCHIMEHAKIGGW